MNENKSKRQKAVALHYKPNQQAPKVVAKGAGLIADKIIERAEEAEVNVYQDAALVEELTRTDIGQQIPPELYEVVAQVLIFINELDKAPPIQQQLGLERLTPITNE